MIERVQIRRALLSVSDKNGLVELGNVLAGNGVEILSTGGTAQALRAAGIAVREVADHTGFPEMMDGRVKTLHPVIHGGLLALRDNEAHLKAMEDHEIGAIDLVVVNLYPFEETVKSGADWAVIIENIDIGGPSMVRSAAKNHRFVTIVVDPGDYAELISELEAGDGTTSLGLRRKLAAKAYARTAQYDAAISTWFANEAGEILPPILVFGGRTEARLRYGENPHQEAAFYVDPGDPRPGVQSAEQLQGKALSFNNLNDTDAAYELVAEFTERAAIAIIKHANPCGVAEAETLIEAHELALACDPVSAFGGIVAANRTVDGDLAEAIIKVFTEVVIAPEITAEARRVFATKKNLRVLQAGALPDAAAGGRTIRSLAGGYLVQSRDNGRVDESALKVVSKRAPTAQEMSDMVFAFRVAKHVKSNAIIYAKDGATVGVGAGQMSRIDSSRIAAQKSKDASEAANLDQPATNGSVVASDAFFPFADGLLAAAEAGATAVIQPGGSIRDDEVIAAADGAGLAMVMTGMRHFRH